MKIWVAWVLVSSLLGCSRTGGSDLSQQGVLTSSTATILLEAPSGSVRPLEPIPQRLMAPLGPAAPPSDGYVEVKVGGVAAVGASNAMLLVHDETRRAIPVFLGGTEGLSLQLRLDGQRYPRPLTHDLLDTVLEELGARVHSARVEKLESNTFFGTLVVLVGDRLVDLDSRTSDAVAMALGSGAPIFVARDVLDTAGISMDTIDATPATEPLPTGIPL